jgi:hypothetical protein
MYKKGRYKEAQEEYEKLAKADPKDPRLRFNAGDAAYRSGDYKTAAGMFEQVLTAEDLKLQQQAWYNLGNARWQTGSDAAEPDQKREEWNQALASYSAALKLDPQDARAKHNYDYVKQQVENLPPPPKQQQDQKKQDDQKDKKDDQKDDQKQDKNQQDSQKKPSDSQKQNQDQNQKKDQKDQSGENKSDKKDQKDGQKQQNQEGQKDGDKQQKQAGDQQGDQNDKNGQPKDDGLKPQQATDQQKAAASQAQAQDDSANHEGRMSARQAQRLLDGQKGEERAFIFRALRGNGYTNTQTGELREARRKAW